MAPEAPPALLARRAPLDLRVNTLKGTRAEAIERLEALRRRDAGGYCRRTGRHP